MHIMANEPAPSVTAIDIKEHFKNMSTVQELADAFAITSNEFWWAEDNVYDYEGGSPEYKAACAIADEWGKLMDFYENKIFEIIRSEGIKVPSTGRIIVLATFMKKYGYDDSDGWWVKDSEG